MNRLRPNQNLSRRIPTGQHGAALAVSLLLLFVMTLIGISTLSTTRMEQRMAGNFQATACSFEATETGVVNKTNGILLRDEAETEASGVYPRSTYMLTDVDAGRVGLNSTQNFKGILFQIESVAACNNIGEAQIYAGLLHFTSTEN